MNFYIRMKDNTTKTVDKAYPFIYEGIQLFTWWESDLEEFQVIESTTGLLLSSKTTEEEALKDVKEKFSCFGIEKIKKKLIELQKEFNISTSKPTIMNTVTL